MLHPFHVGFTEINGEIVHIWHLANPNPNQKQTQYFENVLRPSFEINSQLLNESRNKVILAINKDKISTYIETFSPTFSIAGIKYLYLDLDKIIVPVSEFNKIDNYINNTGLSAYYDLIWYLLAYTQLRSLEIINWYGSSYQSINQFVLDEKEEVKKITQVIKLHTDTLASINEEGERAYTIEGISFKLKGKKRITITSTAIISFILDGLVGDLIRHYGDIEKQIEETLGIMVQSDDYRYFNWKLARALYNFFKDNGIVQIHSETPYPNEIITLITVFLDLSNAVFPLSKIDRNNVRNWLEPRNERVKQSMRSVQK